MKRYSALVNLIYQVVDKLGWPKSLQMYKNLTQFTASDEPLASRSLACVIINVNTNADKISRASLE